MSISVFCPILCNDKDLKRPTIDGSCHLCIGKEHSKGLETGSPCVPLTQSCACRKGLGKISLFLPPLRKLNSASEPGSIRGLTQVQGGSHLVGHCH